jgi:hypothetical protein
MLEQIITHQNNIMDMLIVMIFFYEEYLNDIISYDNYLEKIDKKYKSI